MVKRSLRVPFSLLLLISALTFLSCRSALHRPFGFGSLPFAQPANPHPDSSLLSLASSDPADPALRREVEDLIEGNLPLSARGADARHHHGSVPHWRRDNHGSGGLETRIRPASSFQIRRLRSPKDYRIFPEFRRSLRDWIRLRRLHPQIMSLLPSLIKRPLDLHFRQPEPEPVSGGQQQQLYNSCAVVGNSGILLRSAHGELIDSHDAVIRLNNARTEGYGRHVGSRTTVSFVNSNILHLCARRGSCFCHPYGENVPIVMYICQPVHFLDYATCNSSHKSPLLVTDPRFDVLCASIVKYYSLKRFVEETGRFAEEWGKAHDEKMFHYSSGMQAVMLAAGICERVSVFGFGKSNATKHHYHTNQKAELDLHDYEAEYAFYRDLAEQPQVIPFLNDSGFKVPPVVFYH